MRNPCTSETDACRITFGLAFLVAAAIALGALLAPVWGLLAFAAGVAAAVTYDIAVPQRPWRLRAAAQAPHPADGRHVLVVAAEAPAGTELREALVAGDGARTHLDVVAPVLCSHTHLWTSDCDREVEDARRRLRATLAWAQAQGLDAHGLVGDPNDPLGALEDELRLYGADEAVLVTHAAGRACWVERELLARLRDELDVPLTRAVVDDAGVPIEIERIGAA